MISQLRVMLSPSLLALAMVSASCDARTVNAPDLVPADASYIRVVLDPDLPLETRSAITEIVTLTESAPLDHRGALLRRTSPHAALVVALDAEGRPRAEGVTDGELLVLSISSTAQNLVRIADGTNGATLPQLAASERYRSLEELVRRSATKGTSYYDDNALPGLLGQIASGVRLPASQPNLSVGGFNKLDVFSQLPGELGISNTSLLAFDVSYGGSSTPLNAGSLIVVTNLTAPEYRFLFDPLAGSAVTSNGERLANIAVQIVLTGLGPLGSSDALAGCLQRAFAPIFIAVMLSDDPLSTLEEELSRGKAGRDVGVCGHDHIARAGLAKKLIGFVYSRVSTILGVIGLAIREGPFVDDVIAYLQAAPLAILACRMADGTYEPANGDSCSAQSYRGSVGQTASVTYSWVVTPECTWTTFLSGITFRMNVKRQPGVDPQLEIANASSTATNFESVNLPTCSPPHVGTPQNHLMSGPASSSGASITLALDGVAGNLPGTALTFSGTMSADGVQIVGQLTWRRTDQDPAGGLNWTISVPIVLTRE